MSVIVEEGNPLGIWSYDQFGNLTGHVSDSGYKSFYRRRDRGTTVKRLKPADLLSNMTNLGRSEEIMTDSLATRVATNGSRLIKPSRSFAAAPMSPTAEMPNPSLIFKKKVKDQKMNLAITMGEYRSSCDMFYHTAKLLHDVVRNPGRVGSAALKAVIEPGRVKRAAGVHLQWQYGWLPLISDLKGTVETIHKNRSNPLYRRITAQGTKALSKAFPDFQPGCTAVLNSVRTRKLIAYVQYEPEAAYISPLGLTNPLEVAWELVPYSFVLDWMFPIGSYLSGLDAMVFVKSAVGCTVDKHSLYSEAFTYSGKNTRSLREYNRSANLILETPSFRYSPSPSLKKVIDGLALLAQLRR